MAEPASSEERRTIAVVDGNSLLHRAFHAVPPTMTAPDGRHTNAVFGFLNMFYKMVESFSPDGVICAFDKGKPRVRMEMLPQYKAQRPPTDPSLREQFPIIKELLHALDVPVVECEGWEGDDILGTLAKAGEARGYDMYLVTGDRDMYQLVTEHVKVVSTRKGLSDVNIMTPESVDDLYHGVTPELVPDFYGLKGDSSDNIPGVPGIGPKKAAALICEYGSLDAVIEHAAEIPGKMGATLREHIDDALLSRKVATIRTDAPLNFEFSEARWPTFSAGDVQAAFGKLGITSLTKRFCALVGSDVANSSAAKPAAVAPSAPAVSAASTAPAASAAASAFSAPVPADLPHAAFEPGKEMSGQELLSALQKAGEVGEWLGFAVSTEESDTLFDPEIELWVSCAAAYGKLQDAEALGFLARAFAEYHVAASDIKALMHNLYPVNSSEACKLLPSGEPFDPALCDSSHLFDTGVAAYLLNSSAGTKAISAFALANLENIPEPSDALPQSALESINSRLLVPVLSAALEADGSLKLMSDIEMPLLGVLARMERTGMFADKAILSEQSTELGSDIDASIKAIFAVAGHEFNPNSPKQLSDVLFGELGLPTKGLKRTQSGYSTNAKVLEKLAEEHSIVADVLSYREKAKIKSTYLDALPELIRGDGRIHTTLNQTVTATGRLSSSNPNLQNIPTRSELGHRVRKAFTVEEGNVFFTCDYSQIELRLLAHLSGDANLIAAFKGGEDFHAETAARVFGVPVSEVTHEQRSRAKAVNFGIVYGQQRWGLAKSLGISQGEAQDMIDRYYEAYPGVRAYLDETVAGAYKNGYAITMYGRKRHIPEILSENKQQRESGERNAMNHPMQGSAADIIKLAMIAVDKRMREEGSRSKLIMQIHDELDFEVPTSELELMSKLVKETMEGVAKLRVPLIAEVSYGADWAEAK